MDLFCEQIVKNHRNAVDKIKLIVLLMAIFVIGIAVLIAVSIYIIPLLGIILCGLIFYIGFFLITNTNYEFEYIITNGDMDVAAIYNKSTRKKKLSFVLSEINMIVPTGSPRIDGLITQKKIKKIYDFSSAVTKDNSYDIVIERGGNKEIVRVTLSNKSLDIYKSGAKNIFYAD